MKYFLKKTGEKIEIGDKITITNEVQTPFGIGTSTVKVTVTEEIIPKLIAHGIIEEDSISLDNLIAKIGVRMDLDEDEAEGFMSLLWERAPGTAMTFLLKEASIILNKNKKLGNNVWFISNLDGSIDFMSITKIKNYKTVSIFATKEDAYRAKEALIELFEELYGNK